LLQLAAAALLLLLPASFTPVTRETQEAWMRVSQVMHIGYFLK
jgi:hypothetical protein